MPQVCFTVEAELIERIDELRKRLGARSRSETIVILLKQAVPVVLGKVPLHEGVEPSTSELVSIVQELNAHFIREIERLEKRLRKLEGKENEK